MNKKRYIILALFIAVTHLCATAQEVSAPRKVTNAKMVGIGTMALQDTYLSPEHYQGPELRYISHTTREKDGNDWMRVIINEGNVAATSPRAKNCNIYAFSYHFQYGMMHSWHVLDNQLTLSAGAQGELTAGGLYSTRNGNNPAQVRAMIDIGPMVGATYDIGRVRLRYEASAPLLGLTFSPSFGQSYYEIGEDRNLNGNIVPVTTIAVPTLRHTLTADFTLLGQTWRLGYLGDYQQKAVNDIKQHLYSHAFIIGMVYRINRERRVRW